MAVTVNSVGEEIINNKDGNYLPAVNRGGRGHVYADYYVTDGTETVGSRIKMFTLPQGCYIGGGRIVFEAMGTSATAYVGDTNNPAKYSGEIDVSAANTVETPVAHTYALNHAQRLVEDRDIYITCQGATWASGKRIYLEMIVNTND